MVFSSIIFLFVFLPFVLACYHIINPKFQNTYLFLVSLFFYFYGEPKFVIVILVSIIINYIFGLMIYCSKNSKYIKLMILVCAIVLNLGILFYYKYFDFSIEMFNLIFRTNLLTKNIVLPIGISFFTFQGLTYIIDLYWGNVNVQKNPLKIGLYIVLFPQLIAGPIVRYKDVAEQIDKRRVTVIKFNEGIKRFVLGLGKKTIISNTLATVADSIFNGVPGMALI